MNDTFTQNFVTRKVKSSNDESLIYVRLTLNQERREFGLRIRIKSSEWDSKAQRVKGKSQTVDVEFTMSKKEPVSGREETENN